MNPVEMLIYAAALEVFWRPGPVDSEAFLAAIEIMCDGERAS